MSSIITSASLQQIQRVPDHEPNPHGRQQQKARRHEAPLEVLWELLAPTKLRGEGGSAKETEI